MLVSFAGFQSEPSTTNPQQQTLNHETSQLWQHLEVKYCAIGTNITWNMILKTLRSKVFKITEFFSVGTKKLGVSASTEEANLPDRGQKY